MAHRRLRRSVLLLVLFTLLAAPWNSGAATGPEQPAAGALAERPVELLGRLWARLVYLWGEEGCFIDPYGRCVDGQTNQKPTDAGCHIDPYGVCGPSQESADAGCGLDPYGRCVDGQANYALMDEGCHIDPYGACRP